MKLTLSNKIRTLIFQSILPVLIFILGMGIVSGYLLDDHRHYMLFPGDIGDARFNRYILEHFYLALTGQADSFVNAPMFYPWIKTISFSDTHWGGGLIYALFRSKLIGLRPEDAFLGWFVVGFILNYWAAFWVNRALKLQALGASIGAFFFTFALPVLQQDGHAQLLYRFYVPLAFLALHHYLRQRDPRLLAIVFLLISLQLLTSFYIGMFLCYFLLAYLLAWRFLSKRFHQDQLVDRKANHLLKHKKHYQLMSLTAIMIFILALGLFFLFSIPYLQAHHLYLNAFQQNHSIWTVMNRLPQLRNYIMADNSSFWVSSATISALAQVTDGAKYIHEKQLFVGVGACLAILYAVFSKEFIRTHLLSRNLLVATVIMVISTLSFGELCCSIYVPITFIPGITAIKVVSREILVLVFPISVVVGQVVNNICSVDFKLVNSLPIVLILCALIVMDSVFAIKHVSTRREWNNRISSFEAKIHEPINKDSIIVAAVSDVPWRDNLDAMVYAQTKGIKTMNGYSGNTPLGYVDMKTCEDVAKNIASAEKFYQETLKQPFKLDRKKIIFVGFNSECFL